MSAHDKDKELKELSHAIVDALTHNGDVMGMLADLKERKVIDSTTLLGLALKISDLLEISGMAFTDDEVSLRRRLKEGASAPATERALAPAVKEPSVEGTAMIDGRKLSNREIAFEEWSRERFDEKDWLKDQGLIW